MTTTLEVVRNAFAAMERGDLAAATAVFAPGLVYRLHGDHAFAGEFVGKEAVLGALARLSTAGGASTTLRLANAWPIGDELVAAHLVRSVHDGREEGRGDVATIIRVENGWITEIVSVSNRSLDAHWRAAP